MMKGKGLRSERETIINFNEGDETASIWTASETVYRRLMKRLGRAYLTDDGERHAVFTFPVKFIDLPRIKLKRPLPPERKAEAAARMRSYHEKRASRGIPEGVNQEERRKI